MKKKKTLGFTLAEVLITLGIIGIVAAITLPTVLAKIEMLVFKNRLKVVYSQLHQAYLQLSMEDGFINAISGCQTHEDFKNIFQSKIKKVKDCQDNRNGNSTCFAKQSDVKNLNNTNANSNYFNGNSLSSFILPNGSALSFSFESNTCSHTPSAGPSIYNKRCGYIIVDVNGIQRPNTWGKDIYLFMVYADTIRPSIAGVTCDAVQSDDCFPNDRGITCSSKYLNSNK